MWFKYPYTSYSELNLDWFLDQFKKLKDEWDTTSGEWDQMQLDFQTLEGTVQTFTTFVTHYFDNLDVQQEINNKLDALVADGTLSALLAPLVAADIGDTVADQIGPVVAAQIGDTVADQIDAVVGSQIMDAVSPEVPNAVTAWLVDNVNPVGSAVTLDNTLTISGSAADAMATGDHINAIADIIPSVNLVDERVYVAGLLQSDGTVNSTSYPSDRTSDFIAIEPSTDYIYNDYIDDTSSNVGRKAYLLYDSSKNIISGTYYAQSGQRNLIINNANAYFIRVSWQGSKYPMLEKGNTSNHYEPYKLTSDLKDYLGLTSTMKNEIYNPLKGKKWVPLGDSFTDYTNKSYTGGVFDTKDVTYPRIIAIKNDMDLVQTFMYSGRTIAYPADETFTNSITCPTAACYYQNIPADADIITIMLGINDASHVGQSTGEITLGTIDDNTTDTYYGAYNTVLEWIRNNRPYAHVGIIVTNGIGSRTWTEAQIALARKWGYPMINLNGDDHTPVMIRPYNQNISDELRELIKEKQAIDFDGSQTGTVNTHPNWQAHEYESTFIEAWLKTL